MSQPHTLDLAAYLERLDLGLDAVARGPDPATLRRLHEAHLARIPFENIDVYLGHRVRLDLAALEDKLVRHRRGGYCFEQNTLFAAALRGLGFEMTTLEARVRPPGETSILPRTHMVLRVTAGGAAWLADVGFGGDGPLHPVPLDGTPSDDPAGAYRVERETAERHVLRRRRSGEWSDLYAFTLAPALPVDYEVAHHYTSTYPESVFVRTLTVQRVTHEVRRALRGRRYTVLRGDDEATREITVEELPTLLRDELGLEPSDELVLALMRKLAEV